jgi:hypothetical protein
MDGKLELVQSRQFRMSSWERILTSWCESRSRLKDSYRNHAEQRDEEQPTDLGRRWAHSVDIVPVSNWERPRVSQGNSSLSMHYSPYNIPYADNPRVIDAKVNCAALSAKVMMLDEGMLV